MPFVPTGALLAIACLLRRELAFDKAKFPNPFFISSSSFEEKIPIVMQSLTDHILNSAGSLVVVLDKENKAEYVSTSCAQILGFDSKELLGEGWLQRTRNSDRERKLFIDRADLIRRGISLYSTEERLLQTSDGGDRWILWNISNDTDGKLIGIGYDITERKRQQKNLEDRTRELHERNKEITDSLKYAQRIQESILPKEDLLKTSFSDGFVLYKPKDIVSGDFWYHHQSGDSVFLALADCTGHGVPGALMSVIGHSIFKEIFINRHLKDPAALLYEIDKELFSTLNKNHSLDPYKDGMDVALCRFDQMTSTLHYAGALRPLMVVRKGIIHEIKGCRYPIGFFDHTDKLFSTQQIKLEKGDSCYIYSDGYCDQFGGEKCRKLNKSRFRELLLTIQDMEMEEQRDFLDYAHNNWKQKEEQTDDIAVIGFRI